MSYHSRYEVDATYPRAKALCDRCAQTWNHFQLRWQYQWVGPKLQNLRILVCPECYDLPQPNIRRIVIPPDPLPIMNPRPENYNIEVTSFLQMQEGPCLLTEAGQCIIWEIAVTPNPDPNNPVLIP
jgi:hypothetical protein